MTGRERELAAICHRETDRPPVDVIWIQILPQIAEYLGIEQNDIYNRLGIDGRIVSDRDIVYTGLRADVPDFVDKGDVTPFATLITGDYGTAHWYPLVNASSVADIERYAWPDPTAYNFAGAARSYAGMADKYAIRGPYWLPIFCQICDLFGMEEAMAKMVMEPDVFEATIECVHQHHMEYCRHLIEAFGDNLPILYLGDDFATQRGLMISPELWRKFLKPRYAELFALAKNNGKHMWFHACGDITSVLPDLIDIGIDVWETVQLHTLPMTPSQLKREFGKHLTFFGAVNTQRLPFVSSDEVRDEVIHCIDELGKDGGYICGPDHNIEPDVPPRNVVTLYDTALAYKRQI